MWVGEKWLVERQLNIGGRAYATDLSPRPQCTVESNSKNPPKMRVIKFVKLTDYTYACNCLTNFEYVVHARTGYVNLQKLAWKNS